MNDEAQDKALCLGALSELFEKSFHLENVVEVRWPELTAI